MHECLLNFLVASGEPTHGKQNRDYYLALRGIN